MIAASHSTTMAEQDLQVHAQKSRASQWARSWQQLAAAWSLCVDVTAPNSVECGIWYELLCPQWVLKCLPVRRHGVAGHAHCSHVACCQCCESLRQASTRYIFPPCRYYYQNCYTAIHFHFNMNIRQFYNSQTGVQSCSDGCCDPHGSRGSQPVRLQHLGLTVYYTMLRHGT